MRLIIHFRKKDFTIPIEYQSILQGFIYNIFKTSELGTFYHDDGFSYEHKKFKLFVFSNLFGNFKISERKLHFQEDFRFELSAIDEEFIGVVKEYLLKNKVVVINRQKVEVYKIEMRQLNHFFGIKEIAVKTISPVVTYTTVDKFVDYHKPSDSVFEARVLKNIEDKCKAYAIDCNIEFKLKEVVFEKRRIVKFKNTYHAAYSTKLILNINFETLALLYDTGISSKGPCGFGMIEISG